MQALEDRDYFTDHSILKEPYAYFEAIRAKGPIYQLPGSGIVVVTGFDEILEVLKNTEDFSSVISVQGPAVPLPFRPEGSDITPQIEAHRTEFLGGDLLVAYDDRQHSMSRSLLSKLFTPSRLKANERFIAEYGARLVQNVTAKGGCELIKEIATPFVTMVIADLLGVPADDRKLFMDAIEAGPPPGSLNSDDLMAQHQPLVVMGMYFVGYVQDRRQNPRADILSELANATYPDGSTPDALEIVRLATFLFGAGQDTSAKLLGNTMKFIVDEPGLQERLRHDPSLIPQLLEEVLRLEGSTKMTARLARKDARIGDLKVPAGTKVMLALSAANRDPRRWDDPGIFVLDRPRIKEHLAFGRGAHVCAGAPLARSEVRIILEKFLEHTSKIDLVDDKHGPRSNRTFDYEASFIIRGLSELHLKLTSAAGDVGIERPAVEQKAPASREGIAPRGGGPESPASSRAPYSTADTKIGALLADAGAKAVLDKYFPGVSSDRRIGMAKGMTLRAIQKLLRSSSRMKRLPLRTRSSRSCPCDESAVVGSIRRAVGVRRLERHMSKERVVVVTGGASGIGLGIARLFAGNGHPVAMLDAQGEALEREGAVLRKNGAKLLAYKVDVSARAQVEAAYAAVRKELGPVAIVIANAGISSAAAFQTMSVETWQRMIDVNLTGVFHTLQPALPDMMAAKWGRIVTISSQAAQSGAQDRAHYAASKAGVIGLTRSLAREFARHGITVNTIPPSLVDTPLAREGERTGQVPPLEVIAQSIPIARPGTAEDIAAACEFLCSDEASYVTGQQINVNGGSWM